MTIFDKMLSVAVEVQTKTKDSEHPLLVSNLDDINKYDRDIAENDMQVGDSWLWILKSNGCGTYTVLLDGRTEMFIKRVEETGTQCFLIKVTGKDEADITPVTANNAIGLLSESQVSADRVPLRETLYDQLTELLDLDSIGVLLSGTKLWCDFTMNKGDISYLTIENSGCKVSIYLDRTVFTKNKDTGLIKPSSYYYTDLTPKLKEALSDGAIRFKIHALDSLYAIVTTEEGERVAA